jgi:ribosomal peptide maturation radical SAM protein 1
MFRVILIDMPFADVTRPSIGLSLVKAGLLRVGVPCDIAYLNLRFAELIGTDNYTRIDSFSGEPQLGEWIFAEALFGDLLPEPLPYYVNVLRPALIEPFGADHMAFKDSMEEGELLAGLVSLRKRAAEFLQSCLDAYDWGQYDIVGFTTTFQQNVASLGLARLIKEKYAKVLIAFGGANCEGKMGIALHHLFPFIDIVCSGEADKSFVDLVKTLVGGRKPLAMDGVVHRLTGKAVLPLAATSPIREMDSLPIPDYYDFFSERTKLRAETKSVTLPVESSRGCWWGEKAHCTFCGLNGGTMQFRTKSPDRFLDEIHELVRRHKVSDLAAVDNIIDMRYFQTVLPRLAERDLGLRLFYETKANLQRGQVRLLRESGVTHIQPGIESLSSDVLRLMRKGVHAYQNIRLLRWCAEYLVEPSWNILGGFPGEDPEEYAQQTALIPHLTHLPPPIFVGSVRLDRFSPLFEQSDQAGLQHVRPSDAYHYVYPFRDDELENLVYFFEFDYADGRNPGLYMAELRGAVDRWKKMKETGALVYLDDGEVLTIADRRHDSEIRRHVFRSWQRLVYQQCDEGATLSGIGRSLHEAGYVSESGPALESFLEDLLSASLVVHIDDRYLALSVGGNYRLEALARYLSTGSEVPLDLRRAVQQLFDLHPDGFAHHLALYLSNSDGSVLRTNPLAAFH